MIINPYAFGAAAPAPFSPLDLPNLNAWWDASDVSTITESGGDVSQWDDKSGNGYHLTQGTAASQPATGANTLNGLNVLTFDGSNDSLDIASTGLGRNVSGLTVYVVARLVNVTTSQEFLLNVRLGSNASRFRLLVRLAPTVQKLQVGGRTLDADFFASVTGTTTPASTDFYTITGVYDIANTDLYLYVDGTLEGTNSAYQTATTTSDTDSGQVSVGEVSASAAFDGDIAEVLIYHDAHDATERAQMWDYLNAKWGL